MRSAISRSGWQRYRRGTRASSGSHEKRTQPVCRRSERIGAVPSSVRERKMLFDASFNSSVCIVPMIVVFTTETVPPAPMPSRSEYATAVLLLASTMLCRINTVAFGGRMNRTENAVIDLDLNGRFGVLDQQRGRSR